MTSATRFRRGRPRCIAFSLPPVALALAVCALSAAAAEVIGRSADATGATTSPATHPTTDATYPAIVAIVLNGQAATDSALVMRRGDAFLLHDVSARELRLALHKFTAAQAMDGQKFFALDGIPGLKLSFDEVTQVLDLVADPFLFEPATIATRQTAGPAASRPGFGGYASYDLVTQRTPGTQPATATSAQAEFGFFSPLGVLTHGVLASHAGGTTRGVRLDTTFTVDRPEAVATLRVGDAISRAGTWSGASRFAGVQYATNFNTRPTFITFPLNSATGQTALPSTVDVYINNILTGTQTVPAGPFTLTDLPAVNGQGEIRLVVRDLLGREQAFLKPLYGSTALLRPGLDEFSIQAGRLRAGYGLESQRYGTGFAAGVWRRGVNEKLTFEVGAEAGARQQSGGVGATLLIGGWGQVTAGQAYSRADDEVAALPLPLTTTPTATTDSIPQSGRLTSFAWERRSTTVSVGMQGRWASKGFRTVLQNGIRPARRELSAFASYGAGGTSWSAGYVSLNRPGEPAVEFLQLTVSRGFGDWGYLSLTGAASLAGNRNHSINLNYALPLDFLTTLGASSGWSASGTGTRREQRLSLQRSVPTGDGLGYRLELSDQQRAVLDLRGQSRSGQYGLEFARLSGIRSVRASFSGSLTYLDGSLHAGRRVEEGFGLVKVGGFPNVRVYLDNQELGRTDTEGRFFVARLRPYQVNQLSINPSDLPLSAEVMTLRLDASPYLKSGVVVSFPVKDTRGGILRFIDEAGNDLPAGSVVTNLETGLQHPLAEGGEAFVTDLSPSMRLRVDSNGKRCTIEFNFRRTDDPQPRLGPYICRLRS
ncbi:MAG: fimbria/pilus outer membrane usher protein [Burkholderiales bacterium]|nr:fimbria/pilus outer membrane usher protein [Burkholderiales bacterium]